MPNLQIDHIDLDTLVPFDRNPRTISPERLESLKESVRSLGLFKPLLVWRDSAGEPIVIGGNQRLRALREIRSEGGEVGAVPVVEFDGDEPTARTIALRDNAQDGEWDWHALGDYVADLDGLLAEFESDMDLLALSGFDAETLGDLRDLASTKADALDGLGIQLPDPASPSTSPSGEASNTDKPSEPSEPSDPAGAGDGGSTAGTIAEDFVVPPFTILDQRSAPWKQRRDLWNRLGLRSDLGREGDLIGAGSQTYNDPSIYTGKRNVEIALGREMSMAEFLRDHYRAHEAGSASLATGSAGGRDLAFYQQKQRVEAKVGRSLTDDEFERDLYVRQSASTGLSGSGTSVFDPVLAEVLVRWFAPPGGTVLDPFAGGSVRGIVSALCGFTYTGIDLRPEQVAENRRQWDGLRGRVDRPDPSWIAGDSLEVDSLLEEDQTFDFLLTCPPYGDLEVYSDDPNDLSTKDADDFLEAYREIIRRSTARLRDNRFAAIVIGDYRDKKTGLYRNFVGETISAFLDAGLGLYNEAILMSPVGSWPVRLRRIFGSSRKMAKVHQNILVFWKGDPAKVRDLLGEKVADETAPESVAESVTISSPPSERPHSLAEQGQFTVERPHKGEPDLDGPKWAHGWSLDLLRSLAEPFKHHDRGMVLGAFGAVKENTIAGWLEAGTARVVRDLDGRLLAVFRALTSDRDKTVRDFAGGPFVVPAGTMHITRASLAEGVGASVLVDAISTEAGSQPVVYDGWAEHEQDRAVGYGLGLDLGPSKISAASEIRGVWMTARWDYPPAERAHLVTLALDGLLGEIDALRRAVRERVDGWADHYSSYNKRGSWSALALRGFGGRTDFIEKPAEMSKKWKADNAEKLEWEVADTPLRALLPEVEPIVAAIPGQIERLRLMRLTAGVGELARHADITDRDAGVAPGRLLRIHLVLETNEGVVFEGWKLDGVKVRRHFPVGCFFYLDTRKPHRATNVGPTDRIHLVADVHSTPELLALLDLGDEA